MEKTPPRWLIPSGGGLIVLAIALAASIIISDRNERETLVLAKEASLARAAARAADASAQSERAASAERERRHALEQAKLVKLREEKEEADNAARQRAADNARAEADRIRREHTGLTLTGFRQEKAFVERSGNIVRVNTWAYGTIVNKSTENYRFVQISFSVYRDGALVGSSFANISNLRAWETWQFKTTDFQGRENDAFSKPTITGF